MHSVDELRLHNLNAIAEVVESNQTEQRGDGESLSRGHRILGGAISAINRKKITDPKKQRREIEKIRKNLI